MINDRTSVAQDSELLPQSTISLEEARHRLGTRHLMKEQLSQDERQLLYIAESLLRYVDRLREECLSASADETKLCWCPCGCGCKDEAAAPCGHLLPNGLCGSCNAGCHEIPPSEIRSVEDLIKAHESILTQLKSLVPAEGDHPATAKVQ